MTNLTDENFEKEIKSFDKPVVVDFFATWCGPCTVLGPVLEKVVEGFSGKVVLLKADVNTIPLTSGKFEVDRIPMVAIFSKGKLISNFIGLREEGFIKSWIEESIKNL
jgi:thioredoxin